MREALADIAKGQMGEVEQMKHCLSILKEEEKSQRESDGKAERDEEEEDEEDDDDDDEKASAFEMLSELCENLDNARGLYEICLYLFEAVY